MRPKLDENLSTWCAELLSDEGHDVVMVREQGMCGAADHDLIAACAAERRCLVTLDLGFASPLTFPPTQYAGIAVLRISDPPTYGDLRDATWTLAAGLSREDITSRLWVVRSGRIRVYQERDLGDEDGPP